MPIFPDVISGHPVSQLTTLSLQYQWPLCLDPPAYTREPRGAYAKDKYLPTPRFKYPRFIEKSLLVF